MQLNGMNVFPMERYSPYLGRYYMDAKGDVWSARGPGRAGVLQKLNGSRTPSGVYYTLNGSTYRQDALRRDMQSHSEFAKETAEQKVFTPSATVSTGKSLVNMTGRTTSATEAVAAKGYLLAVIGPTDKLVFGSDPVIHRKPETAKAEAERIARETPGKEVVMLGIVGSVVVGDTVWK